MIRLSRSHNITTRRFPRSLSEAFPSVCAHCIEVPRRSLIGRALRVVRLMLRDTLRYLRRA